MGLASSCVSRAAGMACTSLLDRGGLRHHHTPGASTLRPCSPLSPLSCSVPVPPLPSRPSARRLPPLCRPLCLPLPPPVLLLCVLLPPPPLLRSVVPVARACFACLLRPLLCLAVLWVPPRWPFAAALGPGSLRPGPWVPFPFFGPGLPVWVSPPCMGHTFGWQRLCLPSFRSPCCARRAECARGCHFGQNCKWPAHLLIHALKNSF